MVIIGSDIPYIKTEHISRAFDILNKKNMVIGPTEDGGFWLIGFSKAIKISYPFKNIRWSTSKTLSDTLKSIKKLNISYDFCDHLEDVDNITSYNKWKVEMKYKFI